MVRFSLQSSTLFLYAASAATSSTVSAQECTLNCPIDAPCVLGQADFSNHPIELDHGNGMHCSCPPGWTGLMCDHKYESCTDNMECFHGGECVTGLLDLYGNEQLFCDCTKAIADDGTKYVGKYCETPFDNICDDEGDIFCVNGGACNPGYPNFDANPCLCDDGWEGFHCEFKTGHVPECTLDCQNDGVCVVGVASPSEAQNLHHAWSPNEVDDHMRCLCPPGVGGELCESSTEDCGDGKCYHGGSCVTTTISSHGNTKTEYHCDCTTAANGNDRYAGEFCQYKATAYCDEDDDNLFCVNGGGCQTDATKGCTCTDDFTGFKCEFLKAVSSDEEDDDYYYDDIDEDAVDELPEPVECGDVYCFNGGICIENDISLEDGTEGKEYKCDCSQAYDDSDLYAGSSCQYRSTAICDEVPDDSTASLAGLSFCVHGGECLVGGGCGCLEGWSGEKCEIHELESKPATEQACAVDSDCFNGGKCIETKIIRQDQSVESHFYCDCTEAYDDENEILYAGLNCQFPSTKLCTRPSQDGDSIKGQLFCTNHGQCRDNVQQGCDCMDGFSGISCEYEELSEHPDALQDDDDFIDMDYCGDTVCHNGGVCVTTIVTTPSNGQSEHEYCDCTPTATDETIFAGDSCQYEATVFCSKPREGHGLESAHYCVNGGTCRDHVLQGCDCPVGWTGFHCEYPDDTENLDGDENNDFEGVEECGDNYCFNGGTCEEYNEINQNGDMTTVYECDCTTATDGNTHMFSGPTCEYKSTTMCTTPEAGESLEDQIFCYNHGSCRANPLVGCDCPSGFAGSACDIPIEDDSHAEDGEQCGDSYCYNGGSCVTTKIIHQDGTESTQEHCDCSTAFDEDHKWAGESCEYKSTSFCTEAQDDDSLEGVLFCVNGGGCKSNALQGCDCPPEWDGFSCEFKKEADEVADDIEDQDQLPDSTDVCGDGLVCLNGGQCVTTTIETEGGVKKETKHCDCSTAFDNGEGAIFAGQHCEYKSTVFCTEPGDDLLGVQFCVNGGACQEHLLQGCDCPQAWTGFRCEFQKDADDIVDPSSSDGPTLIDEYEKCGDNFCYNGGKCNPYTINGKTHYGCDCSEAMTENEIFAGRFCQYKSTVFCTEPTQPNSLAGVEFCVNGGECPFDDDVGCGCPTGYEGLKCEFSMYQGQDSEDNIAPDNGEVFFDDDDEYQCHLTCENGGTCAKGAKDLGSLSNTVSHVSHLNKTFDETFFEHCICPDGFIGLQCEHKADVCGDDEHVCLHGSTCVKNNNQHGCDCSQADEQVAGTDHSIFAGDSCQHPATDICILGENYPGRPLYFCVNQGKCRAYVTDEEDPPGCDCVEGWSGPHCEVRIQSFSTDDDRLIENRAAHMFLIILIVAISGIACALTYSYLSRRQNDEDNDPSQSCMYFRRRRKYNVYSDDQAHNIAPRTSVITSGSDPIVASGMSLPPDDEPEPYYDEPSDEPSTEPYRDNPYSDEEPVSQSRDEDGNALHSVDFL